MTNDYLYLQLVRKSRLYNTYEKKKTKQKNLKEEYFI